MMKVKNHIAPKEIINPALNAVKTSASSHSVTRYVTAVPVKLSDVGIYGEGTVVLCDSAGFDDSKGPEVDLANSIGLVNAVRECKSVKPFILNSNKSVGDRGQGIKKLAHTLVDMIPNVKDYIRAFSYGFTKYPVEEREFIHEGLLKILQEMTHIEKNDTAFSVFLKILLKKTKRTVHFDRSIE
eukprot:TRINITY_DN825_c0_g1_i1.p1 TRINITY_DN825_c0_g1~~TRINITY_DN825_c0_g1_i1.p1  ORF type:complete len:184 (-),score=24.21 TRINITY_DN825_c0_g1_i1:23-574(-)